MILEYIPDKGFIINAISCEWGEDRENIRRKLGNQHKEDNSTFDLASFFDGDESRNIERRRDIYRIEVNNKNFLFFKIASKTVNEFFLHYDLNDKLREIEIQDGVVVLIEGAELKLGDDTDACVGKLRSVDNEVVELENGNFLFKKLKVNLANSNSMGGEGNGLSYFYASDNVDHLLE